MAKNRKTTVTEPQQAHAKRTPLMIYAIHGQDDYTPVFAAFRHQSTCAKAALATLVILFGPDPLLLHIPAWVPIIQGFTDAEYHEHLKYHFLNTDWKQQCDWINAIPADGGTFLWMESEVVK